MELGGFVYLDAGIKASFLGSDLGHSYAAWEERDEVREWFGQIFLEKSFTPLARNHEIFRTFYKGLPDNEYLRLEEDQKRLPDTVLTFVEQEKWPQGTYSLVGIKVKERLAASASPFVLWGGAGMSLGLGFLLFFFGYASRPRILMKPCRSHPLPVKPSKLPEKILKDEIYLLPGQRPLWVKEPTGRWRIFKYYSGEEISNYAHSFYARLGMNVFLYALLN